MAVDASSVPRESLHVLAITASPSPDALSPSFAELRGTVGPRRRIGARQRTGRDPANEMRRASGCEGKKKVFEIFPRILISK